MTIREATYADRSALIKLAQLDSARVPDGRLLLAEQEGEPRAAFAVDGRELIADPFHRTTEIAALLRARAEQLRAAAKPLRVIARTPAHADGPARTLRRRAA
ncbi:MAG: hypothetical protein ACRDK9_02680 [Solirubrobacterales bacterium]